MVPSLLPKAEPEKQGTHRSQGDSMARNTFQREFAQPDMVHKNDALGAATQRHAPRGAEGCAQCSRYSR